WCGNGTQRQASQAPAAIIRAGRSAASGSAARSRGQYQNQAWPATAAQAATARRTRFPRSMAGESLPWKRRSRPARAALEAEVDEHLRGRPQEVLVAFRDAE